VNEEEYEELLNTIDELEGPVDVAFARFYRGDHTPEPETTVDEYEGW